MKKLTALFLAVVMMMALATSASADDPTGSITISGTQTGVTYKLYRVFDATVANGSYLYKTNTTWTDIADSGKPGEGYITVSDGIVTVTGLNDEAAAKAFAAKVIEAGKTADVTGNTSGETITFSGLPYGYYVVESSLGSLFVVNTLDKDTLALTEKNKLPTVSKNVDDEIADIGQPLTYTITVAAESGAKNYKLVDTLSNGITYTDVTSVKYTPAGGTETVLVKDTDYTVSFSDQVLTVNLSAYCSSNSAISANDEFEVTYTAKLNKKAVVAGSGNMNEVVLYYGADEDSDGNGDYSKSATKPVFTGEVNIFKYYTKDGNETALAGAKFKLKKSDDKWYACDADGNVSWVAQAEGTEYTSDSNGKLAFTGIADGTYTLVETAPPAGYTSVENKTINPVITVTDGVVSNYTAL